jgi:hypothetical protein
MQATADAAPPAVALALQIDAERALLQAALADPLNQRFVLLSGRHAGF